MSFDILGARKAGYSDEEIAQEMSRDGQFDASGALRSGYSLEEIHGEIYGGGPVGTPGAPGQEIVPEGVAEQGIMPTPAQAIQNIPGVASKIAGTAGEIIGNIPRSGKELGENLLQTVIHPIETGKAVGKTGLGAIRLLIPGEQGYEQMAEGIGEFFKERYGGLENLQKTIIEDPVGFAADAASLLTGIGAILRTIGIAGKISRVAQAGKAITEAGRMADPLTIAAKGAGQVYRGARAVGTGIAGKTSGIGQAARQKLLAGAPEAKQVMRGAMAGEEIVEEARVGLEAVRSDAVTKYVARLNKMKQATKDLDIKSLRDKLDDLMISYRIERVGKDLKFKKGGVQRSAIEEMKEVIETIDSWGTEPGELTAIGLDGLKRYLGEFYSPNKNTSAMVARLEKTVKDIIVKDVPEYAVMTKDYSKTINLTKEMKRALSIGTDKSADTALRKLITGIKEDSGFRRQLMDELKDYSGKDIQAMIAGYVAQPKVSRAITTSIFGGAGLALPGIFGNPYLFALMPLASPRVVGELLVALGKGERALRAVQKAGVLAAPKRQIMYQTGRIGLMPEMEQ